MAWFQAFRDEVLLRTLRGWVGWWRPAEPQNGNNSTAQRTKPSALFCRLESKRKRLDLGAFCMFRCLSWGATLGRIILKRGGSNRSNRLQVTFTTR